MPLRSAGLIGCITAVLLARVLKAEAGETRDLVPEDIQSTVSLGMSGPELAAGRPRARLVTGDLNRGNLVELLPEGGLWDGVLYGIRGGRLTSLSLSRGGVRLTGTAETVREALRLAIDEYGNLFERRAERSTYNVKPFLSPVLVWRKPEYNAFFSFVPAKNVAEGEKAGFRLTLAERDLPINELFELPDPAVERRFIDNEFAVVLSVQGVEPSPGSNLGTDRDLPQNEGEGGSPVVSRGSGWRREWPYVALGIAMGVLVCVAGVWLVLRRRRGG
jgi:hypothetical protein